jgi:hypothetical protein
MNRGQEEAVRGYTYQAPKRLSPVYVEVEEAERKDRGKI